MYLTIKGDADKRTLAAILVMNGYTVKIEKIKDKTGKNVTVINVEGDTENGKR